MNSYSYNFAQCFEVVVQTSPDNIAISFGERNRITYRQLDRISNQVARFLLKHGVKKRDRICICLEKTLAPYAIMLASLKIGATYFAIDPCNPKGATTF